MAYGCSGNIWKLGFIPGHDHKFQRVRWVKYGLLTVGTLFFIAGILTAVYALAHAA